MRNPFQIKASIPGRELASGPEWSKASDWGDVDLDGDIDQHIDPSMVGVVINDVEMATIASGSSNAITRCHTDNYRNNFGDALLFDTASSGIGSTENCRSRYGRADHVGNVMEWVANRLYDIEGIDNGMDGMWYGHQLKDDAYTLNVSPSGYDLWRGTVPKDKFAGADLMHSGDARNFDNYFYSSGSLRAITRGSTRNGYNQAGHWTFNASQQVTASSLVVGFVCALSH